MHRGIWNKLSDTAVSQRCGVRDTALLPQLWGCNDWPPNPLPRASLRRRSHYLLNDARGKKVQLTLFRGLLREEKRKLATDFSSCVVCIDWWSFNTVIIMLRTTRRETSVEYGWRQLFWSVKCVNWNLGASHLPEVCPNGWKGREGRGGKGANLTAFLNLIPSVIQWSAYWALPPRSAVKNCGVYYTCIDLCSAQTSM
jgi:hypothetical protein